MDTVFVVYCGRCESVRGVRRTEAEAHELAVEHRQSSCDPGDYCEVEEFDLP